MSVSVVTPPEPVVTLARVKQHLRVLHDAEDDLIESYVAAATAMVDAPGGWLGRAIGMQILEARFDQFDANGLLLPAPPIEELVSVKYIDRDNIEREVDLADCALFDRELVPAHGKRWPRALDRRESVMVRYRAGYDPVPAAIISAVLLMVGDLYANRETASEGLKSEIQMSATVQNLLAPYRVYV